MKKDLLKKKMSKKKLKFKLNQWETLQNLLECGYSLNESLHFFGLDKVIADQTFYEHFISNRKNIFYDQLKFFYDINRLEVAIKNAFQIVGFRKSIQNQLMQMLCYPLIVFMFSIVILFFFISNIIPQLMSQFDINTPLINVLLMLPEITQYFMIGGILIIIFLLVLRLFFNTIFKDIMLFFISKSNLSQQIISYYFIGYYVILYQCGLSGKQIMSYLMRLKKSSIIYQLAYKFNKYLNEGRTLNEIIANEKSLSKECKYSFYMAFNSNKVEKFLLSGKTICETKLKKQLKLITIIIQIIAYSAVIIIVMIIYQMMLLPLDMIQNL